MHLWRYITTRFPANIERSSLKTSNAFVLWRYIDVQIWRVKELFVPGIVASTIKRRPLFTFIKIEGILSVKRRPLLTFIKTEGILSAKWRPLFTFIENRGNSKC